MPWWNEKFGVDLEEHDAKYFDVIKRRKIKATDFSILFQDIENSSASLRCTSLDFAVPTQCTKVEVTFKNNFEILHHFDVTKCICPFISFTFTRSLFKADLIKLKTIYDQLILKDLSKEIVIISNAAFKVSSTSTYCKIYKMPHISKFYQLDEFGTFEKNDREFLKFIKTYMDDEGVVNCISPVDGIPLEESVKTENEIYSYSVSVVKRFMDNTFSNM
uniref:Uncharacterized protein n=1 Tax=Panagrolaimus sp. ES5 TaxID=591445 RepID=A0AC34FHT1_9BILA